MKVTFKHDDLGWLTYTGVNVVDASGDELEIESPPMVVEVKKEYIGYLTVKNEGDRRKHDEAL